MNSLEIIKIIELLKDFYQKDVIMIQSISDNYDEIAIETMYGDLIYFNRKDETLKLIDTE